MANTVNIAPIRKSHQPTAKPRPATAALGFAIGWWLFLIGLLFTVFATIGFVFEYYRGNFSH